ncbi:MAG TPA: YidB family protein, partial [Roseiarcus sp.]|nr:YidB family protein [Roseiarcus sp.]
MGMFDDAMKNSVPGGNLMTPIAVAAGALILGKLFGGGSSSASSPAPTPASVPANPSNSSVLEGLGGLLGRLTQGGAGQQVNSWVGP